ncbi:hypothetical protein, partial [Longimycelium tulufanense]|uniref:hypothetical protein n=1 Tax=Longimycelium tulufanense TaxID=907463 RepID=UPI001E4133C5
DVHARNCRRRIRPGDVYLEIVMSPDHSGLGSPYWRRFRECAPCAEIYGRGHLLASGHKET